MTDQELLDHAHIVYDASFDLYKAGDIEQWDEQSSKAVFYVQVFTDINNDIEYDDFVIHADDLKTFPDGNYEAEAKELIIDIMRSYECLLKEANKIG